MTTFYTKTVRNDAADRGKMGAYDSEWARIRALALARDHCQCAYCHDTQGLDVHHIRPVKQGGKHVLHNTVTLCRSCHLQEHGEIKRRGLCMIPGPSYEPHRYELTDHKAVIAYAAYLDSTGSTGDYLRLLERERPIDQ